MLRNGHGGLYKAPTKEERREQKAERRVDPGFERWQVVRFRKARRRKSQTAAISLWPVYVEM